MDDFTLNVRQITDFPAVGGTTPSDAVLIQQGGPGGPYAWTTPAGFLAGTLGASFSFGGLQVLGVSAPFISAENGETMGWNWYFDQAEVRRYLTADVAGTMIFGSTGFAVGMYPAGQSQAPVTAPATFMFGVSPSGDGEFPGSVVVGRGPIAQDEVIPLFWARSNMVMSFNGRFGTVGLELGDIIGAGGAPQQSPHFTGCPTSPSPQSFSDNSDAIANTCWVQNAISCQIGNLLWTHPFCWTFMGRTGDIVLTGADITTALADNVDPPQVATAPVGDSSNTVASTEFVTTADTNLTTAFNQTFAPINSPVFTGNPTGPTALAGDASGNLATTAFVTHAIVASTTGVASFNTRTGAVVLTLADVTAAGGAPLASPHFTGTPQSTTPPASDNSTNIATTAYVKAVVAGGGVVSSFNGRTGTVLLTTADITGAGGAVTASPVFTGNPQAPTQPITDNSTNIATTAYVNAMIAAPGGVTSWNGRNGAVTLNANDLNAVGGPFLALTGGSMTGNITIQQAAGVNSLLNLITTPGALNIITGQKNVSGVIGNRWQFRLGDGSAETGSNAGSNLVITRHDDTGVSLGNAFMITRSTGQVNVPGGFASTSIASPFTVQGTTSTLMYINGPVNNRYLYWQTSGSTRWVLGCTSAAESGSNAGSNLVLSAYDDTGALLSSPISIVRSTGVVTIPNAYITTISQNPAIATANPTLTLNATPGVGNRVIWGATATSNRWQIILGNSTAESGSNVGSDFSISRYSDTGAFLGTPIAITRSTGQITQGATSFNNNVDLTYNTPTFTLNTSTTGARAIQSQTAGSLRWIMYLGVNEASGSNLYFRAYQNDGVTYADALIINRVAGQITTFAPLATPLTVIMANPYIILDTPTSTPGTHYIYGRVNGLYRWAMALGDATTEAGSNAGSLFTLYRYNDAGTVIAGGPVLTFDRAAGLGTVLGPPTAALGIATKGYVDAAVVPPSDIRIKDVAGDYGHGLAEIMRLRPVWYRYKHNGAEPQVGLVAQDIEDMMPELVKQEAGYGYSDLRHVDTRPLILALVNAVKELTARVSELERGRLQ